MFFKNTKTNFDNMLFSKSEVNKIVFPLVAQQILASTSGIINSIMVSNAGEAAISGVGLVSPLDLLLMYLYTALASGGAVVISQLLGKKDIEASKSASKQLIWVVFIISSIVSLIACTFNSPILNLIFGKTDADVMKNAQDYFFFIAISYPFLGIYNAGAAIFRAMGNSKISFTSSLLTTVVHILCNAILIFGFKMGATGAAISTTVSRLVGAVLLMVLLYKKDNIIYIEKLFKTKFESKIIKNICGIGIPNGLENSMFQFGKVITQSLVSTFGTAHIVANSVGNTVTALQYTAGSAIGMAMITIIGRCIGAQEKEQAKKYTNHLLKMAYAFIISISLVMCIFVKPIVGIYNLSPESSSLTIQIILTHSLCVCTIWPIAFPLPNAFRAASDVRFTMIVSICSMWVFRVFFSYVFGKYMGMGVMGVWYAMFCDWTFRAIVFGTRYIKGVWLTKYKPLSK